MLKRYVSLKKNNKLGDFQFLTMTIQSNQKILAQAVVMILYHIVYFFKKRVYISLKLLWGCAFQ